MHRSTFAVLILALPHLACDSGGGGGLGGPISGFAAWSRQHQNNSNTAASVGTLDFNNGEADLLFELNGGRSATLSTPVIGDGGVIYFGTSRGIVAVEAEPEDRTEPLWYFEQCASETEECKTQQQECTALCDSADRACAAACECPAACECVAVGPVSGSPTVSPRTELLLFGSEGENGRFYHIEDEGQRARCIWSFPAPSRTSPIALVRAVDFSLSSIVFGSNAGSFIALDSLGRRRWSFPADDPGLLPVTSAPALGASGFFFTMPDGHLYATDTTGRVRWNVEIGAIDANVLSAPSPAVLGGVHAVGANHSIWAVSENGVPRWTFQTRSQVLGSPAVSAIPIGRGGGFVAESVVVVVDRDGTAYGIGSESGDLTRFCTLDNTACTPSTCPGGGTCEERNRCSQSLEPCESAADCGEGETCDAAFLCADDRSIECFRDTCLIDEDTDRGTCAREARVPLSTENAITVLTSPAFSSDGFVVVTTAEGTVCARRLDGSVASGQCSDSLTLCTPDSCPRGDSCCGPNDGDTCTPGHCRSDPGQACTFDDCPGDERCDSPWANGCIDLPDDVGAVAISSAIIGSGGDIFLTTEKGLVRIQ